MFKELGQFASLMRNLPKMKEEMDRLQQQLALRTAEGDAGGGMVKVRVNGKLEVLSCTLADDALSLNDREMLEDLIRAATNQALDRMRQELASEAGKMAAGLGLFPGLGGPGSP